ncbi:MAG: hypothetical protein J5640_03140 [Bacteroidales bacterium]|nr:hypothetical protein [Bacteroidales bacterium]
MVDVVLCKDNKVLVALYAGVSWKSQADGGGKKTAVIPGLTGNLSHELFAKSGKSFTFAVVS